MKGRIVITIRDLASLPIFVYGDGNKKVPGALS
ncbi:protein--protein lipoyl transferase, partial [Streptococcus pyogenes]